MKESAQAALSYLRSKADTLGIAAELPREDRHPHPLPGRRHPEGRPERGRHHPHRARLAPHRHPRPLRRRDDRRDHAARPRAAGRRHQGEGPRRAPRRHQAGHPPGAEREGPASTSPSRRARSSTSSSPRTWTRCSRPRSRRTRSAASRRDAPEPEGEKKPRPKKSRGGPGLATPLVASPRSTGPSRSSRRRALGPCPARISTCRPAAARAPLRPPGPDVRRPPRW